MSYADSIGVLAAQADAEIASLTAQIVTLNNKAQADQALIDSLKAKQVTDEALIASLRTQVADQTALVTTLQTQLAAANAEIARLNAIINPPPVDPQPTGPNIVRYQDQPKQDSVSKVLASAAVKGKQVSFAPGTYEAVDFVQWGNNYGFFDNNSAGVLGSGVDKTIFQMKPNSSSRPGWYEDVKRNTAYKVGDVRCTAQNGWAMKCIQAGTTGAVQPTDWTLKANNALPGGTLSGNYTDGTVIWQTGQNTNPIHDMYFMGANFKKCGGFWLKATPQGHLRGGLRFSDMTGGLVQNVKVSGYAGSNPGNPGEIFTLATNRANGMTFENVELDGRDEAGNRVGVSMLGLNNGSDATVKGGYFHHTRTDMGAGVAAWQMNNITYIGTKVEETGSRGFSHERCGGTIILDHVTALKCKGSHAKFDSDLGSAVVNIIDPVFDGPKFLVKINATYLNGQKQRREDIHLFVGGVERPDLLQIF